MKTLVIAFFLFSAAGQAYPQGAKPRLDDSARLFETISHELPCGDAQARLDLFFAESGGDHSDMKTVAIYYEGHYLQEKFSRGGEKISERLVAPVFGEAQYRIRWLQMYANFRGFPKERIAFVFGGYRSTFAVDLWLVPRGSADPKPEPKVERMKFRSGEFTYFHCV